MVDTIQATTHMLSTIDNPFNPWTDYDEWLAYDELQGYYSNALLARVVITSDALSIADQRSAIEDGISEIVSQNVSGVHISVPEK
jgi:hypothetical protein